MKNSSIRRSEAFDNLPDDKLLDFGRHYADYLFTRRPSVDKTLCDDLACWFRYLAEKRTPVLARAFVIECMTPYTSPGGAHYSEGNVQYLIALSAVLQSHDDYRYAFKLIGKAMLRGDIALPHQWRRPPKPTD